MPRNSAKAKSGILIPSERIENLILLIRGKKVMIDADLADLYQVPTKRLNEQVKRNMSRFPEDFMFQLTDNEKMEVVANCDHLGNLKFSTQLPYVFTEQGVAMLSSVLTSQRAVDVNILIMRTFTKLREIMLSHKELAEKIEQLERKFSEKFDVHEQNFTVIFKAIRQLLEDPKPSKKRPIGFHVR